VSHRSTDWSADAGHVLGVDLGGTKVRAALAAFDGRMVAERTVPTDADGGPRIVEQIVALSAELCSDVGADPTAIRATAVGSAGVPDASTGGLGLSPNINGIGSFDVVATLGDRLGHLVVVDNDVNMAAIGERHAGHARGIDDFVFLAVGTGVGMGIVSDGRLLRGSHGAAGEVGYLPVGADPFDPMNHRRGAFEEAVAGGTVEARYLAATGTSLTTRAVFDLAATGDSAAVAVVTEHARLLALAIVAVCSVLDPGMVVLGGGVGSRPELLGPTRSFVAALRTEPVDLRTSALGDRAAVVGAVCCAINMLHASPQKEHS